MSFKTELKEFLLRDSVVDMAVGIVIGAALERSLHRLLTIY